MFTAGNKEFVLARSGGKDLSLLIGTSPMNVLLISGYINAVRGAWDVRSELAQYDRDNRKQLLQKLECQSLSSSQALRGSLVSSALVSSMYAKCLSPACDNVHNVSRCQNQVLKIKRLEDMVTDHTLPCGGGTTWFHSYWTGPMKRTGALSIQSFLQTQPQCSRIILWHESLVQLNGPIVVKNRRGRVLPTKGTPKSGSDYLKPLLENKRFELRFFDAQEMAKDTIYEKYVDQHIVQPSLKGDDGGKYSQKMVGFTDFVRFFVLHLHGGVYIDLDVLLLRDMSVLLPLPSDANAASKDVGLEFAYQWGKLVGQCNTAILSLRKNGIVGQKLAKEAFAMEVDPKGYYGRFEGFHPLKIMDRVRSLHLETSFLLMPSFLFDPFWLLADEQDSTIDYYKMTKWKHFTGLQQSPKSSPSEVFFPGAFTYHWHNLWDEEPTSGSWFDQFEKSYMGTNTNKNKAASTSTGTCPFSSRIYVYPLPSRFNTDVVTLLKNTTRKDWANYRTGPGITDSIYDWKSTMLDFATEMYIHTNLMESSCRTTNPDDASIFFIPIYTFYLHWLTDTGCTGCQNTCDCSSTGLADPRYFDELLNSGGSDTSVFKEIGIPDRYWKKNRGCDHIMVASRVTMTWEPYAIASGEACTFTPILLGIEFRGEVCSTIC